jgi:hypothetical protein
MALLRGQLSFLDPPADKPKQCAGCGSSMLHFVKSEVHFGRFDCLKCGKIGPWLKSPWTLERARAFVMPIGKLRGKSVGDLADDKQGRSYLAWAAENLDGNAGTAAAIALGLKTPETMEGDAS